MFGFRNDGKKLKHVDPIIKLTGYIMPTRNDAQVEALRDINCTELDNFIKEQSEKGIKISYMHVVIAGIVRMLALRPRLNRFFIGGRNYARNNIYVSFAVKKRLDDDADETTLKLCFTGHESIFDIKKMIDDEISKTNIKQEKSKTDNVANALLKLPPFILSFAVGIIKLMDKLGILPKKLIEASPFHTSCFVTNLKSIGGGFVYHHCYNFGNTGIFVSMGKEKVEPVVNLDGVIEPTKIMKLGITIDERNCDGFYAIKSLKMGSHFMENPKLLEERLDTVVLDPDL